MGRSTVTTARTINDGAWHHLVVALDRTASTASFYVDGTLDATGSAANAAGLDLNASSHSWHPGITGSALAATLDDIAVYNRALTANEVARHYNVATHGPLPTPDAAPTISGTARDGQALTATAPAWNGGRPVSTTGGQWQRCDPTGSNCAAIDGAATLSYQLSRRHRPHRALPGQRHQPRRHSNEQLSPSARIEGIAPSNATRPMLSGTAREGEELTVDDGSWSGSPPVTCTTTSAALPRPGASCVDIPAADEDTYDPQAPGCHSTRCARRGVRQTDARHGGDPSIAVVPAVPGEQLLRERRRSLHRPRAASTRPGGGSSEPELSQDGDNLVAHGTIADTTISTNPETASGSTPRTRRSA